MPCNSPSIFQTIPERPPTPPKDISNGVDDALRFLHDHDEPTLSSARSTSMNPFGIPAVQHLGSLSPRVSTTAKRVGFSTTHTYHDTPDRGKPSSPIESHSGQAFASKVVKPLRSILKPSQGIPPLSPDDLDKALSSFSPEIPGSFRNMLNSVLQQLGSQMHSARLDAYLALNGALRIYDGIPDPDAMIEKGRLLAQFITRDMVSKDVEGRVDVNITIQALQLATTLLFNARTTQILDHDFRTMVLERSITVLEQEGISKAILKAHMVLLCQQRLYVSCLTSVRAEKIVTALQTIQDRCSGNSIIPARVLIYQRLLEQAPGVMLTRLREWIENVFHGLLSSIKETRLRSLETCIAAGARLGLKTQACKIVQDLFNKQVGEDQTYDKFFNSKLVEMLHDTDAAAHAPQIWGAVISFFRDRKRPIGKWVEVNVWFPTIQQCLNRSDIMVKTQAHAAWNKLVFVVMPDLSTQPVLRSMLKLPILAPFETRGPKHFEQLRRLALDSFCNLLHYALRPGLSHEEIDAAWDLYVDDVLRAMSKSGGTGKRFACAVLGGLFQKSEGAWNENAACAPQAIAPSELRRLDPRWLRSRLNKVIKVMEPILTATMFEPLAGTNRSWKLLSIAIAEAGSQEVKTSNELKEAIAQLTNLFRRLWNARPELLSDAESSQWLTQYRTLLQIMITSLGPGHFTKECMIVSNSNEVEAALTPANRISKHAPAVQPAFVYILSLYHQSTSGQRANQLFRHWPTWLLRLVTGAKISLANMIVTLERASHHCTRIDGGASVTETQVQLWTAIADRMIEALDMQTSVSPCKDSNAMGPAFKSAISIVQHGLVLSSVTGDLLSVVASMYSAICKSALCCGGAGGLLLGVIEPLAKSVIDLDDMISPETILRVASVLLENHRWPQNQQALDQGQKALWPISLDTSKSTTDNSFDHIYNFVERTMRGAYGVNAPDEISSRFIKSFMIFLRTCPASILPAALRKAHQGLVIWIVDSERKIFRLPRDELSSPRLAADIATCWPAILRVGDNLPSEGAQLLQLYEPLLVAGLCSPCREIVNSSIEFWNSKFGSQGSHEYSPRLLSVLKAHSRQTNVLIPGVPEELRTRKNVSLPDCENFGIFLHKPTELFSVALASRISPSITRPEKENVVIEQHIAQRRLSSENDSPDPSAASCSATPTKIRHGDSQAHFASTEPFAHDANCDSHLLAEDQEVIYVGQHEGAHIFPEISSSPPRISLSESTRFNKKLDFIADVVRIQDSDLPSTPIESADGNPMSDDLPSSPTPRSVSHIKAPAILEDRDEEDSIESEPPSSPPRLRDTRLVSQEATQIPARAAENGTIFTEPRIIAKETVAQANKAVAIWSDLASDTTLPEEQLHREAAAADLTLMLKATSSAHLSEDAFAKGILDSSLIERTQASQPDASSSAAESLPPKEDSENVDSPSQVSEDPRGKGELPSKKRKQVLSNAVKAAKRRKLRSPFNYIVTSLFGQRRDEEYIGEEIVVARRISSEKRPSPSEASAQMLDQMDEEGNESKKKKKQEEKDVQENIAVFRTDEPNSESAVDAITDIQPKRRRGRPRKSKKDSEVAIAPTTSSATSAEQQQPPNKRSLKRRASLLDTNETSLEGQQRSGAGPPKLRRLRERSGAQLVHNPQRVQEDVESSRPLRRVVGVMIGSRARDADVGLREAGSDAEEEQEGPQLLQEEINDEEEEEEEEEGPAGIENTAAHIADEQQISQYQTTTAPVPREILAPKGMLGQLRGMLSTLTSYILDPHEEREFDDVLFELRCEVHEAGRRGRKGEQ